MLIKAKENIMINEKMNLWDIYDSVGGALIATKQCLELTEQPQAQAGCECIWLDLSMKGWKWIFICSYYRPKEDDLSIMLEFEKSFNKLPTHRKRLDIRLSKFSTLWLGKQHYKT